MKTNKGWMIGLIATGAVVAGAIVYLTATKSGKKLMKKWGVDRKNLEEGMAGVMKDAKKKFKQFKDEFAEVTAYE